MPVLYVDVIKCPGCATIQPAVVTHTPGAPWATWMKECDQCGYIIIESEWESLLPSPPDPESPPQTLERPAP